MDVRDFEEIDVGNGKKVKVKRDVTWDDKERQRDLCSRYDRVVAWTYDDIRGYYLGIIQHTIDLAEGSKPVRQKQTLFNMKVEALMVHELTKLIDSKIIYLIKHSTWV